MKRRVLGVAAAAAVGLTLALAQSANAATVYIGYSLDGGATILPAMDFDPSASKALTFFSAGGWDVSVASGTAAPAVMAPTLLTTSATATGVGTLDIYITSVGNLSPLGNLNFLSGFTSNVLASGGLTVTGSTWLDSGNALFGLITQLGAATFPPLVGSATDVGFASTGAGPYSLTAQYHIVATGQSSNTTITVSVPGPIVGAGLPGLVIACGVLIALARRRRRKFAHI